MDFDRIPSGHEEILKFLKTSRTALPVVRCFEILLNQRNLSILSMDHFSQAASAKGAAASFLFSAGKRFFYWDHRLSLGEAVMAWAHEIYHATDPEFEHEYFSIQGQWKDLRKTLHSEKPMVLLAKFERVQRLEQLRILNGEKRAYDFQQKVLNELSRIRPVFSRFLRERREARVLNGPISEEEIKKAYNLHLI